MPSGSILQSIRSKIQKQCEKDFKKLQKEQNEIKQVQIGFKVQKKSLEVILDEIKKLSDKQWDQFIEEFFEPTIKQTSAIEEKFDSLVYARSKTKKEIETYEKIKKISTKGNEEIVEIIDKADLNKNQLQRFFVLIYNQLIIDEISRAQNNLDFYEFNQAGVIVSRRFGFNYNWLVCMSLIQLHENLIKKRLTELGGEIREDEPLRVLISKLAELIKEKEKREISFALLLSNGIKTARDTMSHEGYKHPVSKQDLENLFDEIAKLENILYPSEMNV